VREFVQAAAKELGMTIHFSGEGLDEKGVNPANGKTIVAVDPRYFRPTEVETLLGDPAKGKRQLGWSPKVGFEELVAEMVRADLDDAKKEELCVRAGFCVNSPQE
jgi:GDPmannose 4,6-dehydratase